MSGPRIVSFSHIILFLPIPGKLCVLHLTNWPRVPEMTLALPLFPSLPMTHPIFDTAQDHQRVRPVTSCPDPKLKSNAMSQTFPLWVNEQWITVKFWCKRLLLFESGSPQGSTAFSAHMKAHNPPAHTHIQNQTHKHTNESHRNDYKKTVARKSHLNKLTMIAHTEPARCVPSLLSACHSHSLVIIMTHTSWY